MAAMTTPYPNMSTTTPPLRRSTHPAAPNARENDKTNWRFWLNLPAGHLEEPKTDVRFIVNAREVQP